jgi:hypothetical protein
MTTKKIDAFRQCANIYDALYRKARTCPPASLTGIVSYMVVTANDIIVPYAIGRVDFDYSKGLK